MQCYLCGQTLNDTHQGTVPTTDGGRVHIVCADRAAHTAHEARKLRALITAALLSTVLLAIWLASGLSMLSVALASLLSAMHISINLLWWRRLIEGYRLRYRVRRRR